MAVRSLQAALDRARLWERHHVPKTPLPITRKSLASAEDRVADGITGFAGSLPFVYLHTLWFGVWIIINAGVLVAVGMSLLSPFDPFPFGLLTLIVSLEAIFLSTFVMLSQNRQAAVADARAAADYEVNVRAEAEIARQGQLLEALVEHVLGQSPTPPAQG